MALSTSDTVSDGGYVAAAEKQAEQIRTDGQIDAAILAAMALWQRYVRNSAADMENEIAESSMQISEELLAHYEKFWPHEKEFVDEIFAEERPKENFEATSSIFKSYAMQALAQGRKDWQAYIESKCESVTRCSDARWLRLAGATEVDAANFGLRTEEAWTRAKVDRWYSRRLSVLGLGKDVLSQMVSFQNAYNTSGNSVGDFLGGSINALGEAAGYMFKGPGIFDSWGSQSKPTSSAPATMPVPVSQTSIKSNTPYGDRVVEG